MFKNVSGQKALFFAFNATTNLPVTGDAANQTPYVSKDGGTVTVLGSPTLTEMDSTNAKGFYIASLAQAETNGNMLLFSGKSTTANVVVIGAPSTVFTAPANFTAFNLDSNGRVDLGYINETPIVGAGGTVDASLVAAGMDRVLVESGIVASASLTDDSGSQLTAINARQMLALLGAVLEGVLAGAATTNVTIKPAAVPAGNTRVNATVDSSGNRSALTLKVPV